MNSTLTHTTHRRSPSLDTQKPLNLDAFYQLKYFDDSTSEKQRQLFQDSIQISSLPGKAKNIKPRSNCIDWSMAAQLVPQEPSTRKSYLAILKHIQRIPEKWFEYKFIQGVQDLQRLASGKRPLLAISKKQPQSQPKAACINDEKSFDWLIRKVQVLAPHLLTGTLLLGKKYFSYGMHKKRIFHNKRYYAHQTINLVFIDDASYSGSQMKGMINNCLDFLKNNDTKVGNVYILLTAISSAAKKQVQENGFILLGKPIHMPSYRELADGHSKLVSPEDAAAIKEHFRLKKDGENYMKKTLTYFPHKMPDRLSIYLPDKHTLSLPDFDRLIPEAHPPYKLLPNSSVEIMEHTFLIQLQSSDHQLALEHTERFVRLHQTYIDLWFDKNEKLPRDQLGNLLVKTKKRAIKYANSWYKKALKICSQKKHIDALTFLIRSSAHANQNIGVLYNLFSQALQENHLEVVKQLVQYAQPNLREKIQRSLGEIRGHLCLLSSKFGSKNLIEALSYLFLQTNFWTPQEKSDYIRTMLVYMVRLDVNDDAIEELFFHPTLISQSDRQAWAFDLAKKIIANGRLNMLKLLFKNSDIFNHSTCVDWIVLLLKTAIEWNHLDILKFLFSESGMVTTEMKQQRLTNLIKLATFYKSEEILKFLTESVAAPFENQDSLGDHPKCTSQDHLKVYHDMIRR